MGLRISPEALDKLVRANRIAENVWSLDNILRVLSYSGLLGATVLTEANGGKETPMTQFLTTMFNKVTDARFINRVGGFPSTLESLFSLAQDKDKSIHSLLSKIMTWSMIIYYPLEHTWLLSTFNNKLINIDGDKWSMWSCRAWAVYVIADLVGTFLRIKALSKALARIQSKKVDATEKERKEMEEKRKHLYIWSTCALSDLVMALHWSVDEGPVSTKQICAVGIYGGLASLYLKFIKSAGGADSDDE